MRTARITVYMAWDNELDVPDCGMALDGGDFYWLYEPIDIIELYYINGMLRWPFNEN